MHLTRLVIGPELPEQFHLADIGDGESFLVLLPAGTLGIMAVSEPVGSPAERTSERNGEQQQSPFH